MISLGPCPPCPYCGRPGCICDDEPPEPEPVMGAMPPRLRAIKRAARRAVLRGCRKHGYPNTGHTVQDLLDRAERVALQIDILAMRAKFRARGIPLKKYGHGAFRFLL